MTTGTDPEDPDPYAILMAWLNGRYTRPDGLEVIGRVWDDDTVYRYRLAIGHWPTTLPGRPDQSWLAYIAGHVWHFEPLHLADWASRLVNQNGTAMDGASRARAVSAVTSFYHHCENDLGASAWELPARRLLIGPLTPADQPGLSIFQMDALRTAADRYRGPLPERARLAVYLTLAGLRPGQSIALRLENIARHDQNGPTWRLHSKNNSASAVAPYRSIPRPVVWALDEYLPVRTHRGPHSTADRGPLLVSGRGRALDRVTFSTLLRAVADAHPDLRDIAPTLRPDIVAHSPTPFAAENTPPPGRPLQRKPRRSLFRFE